VTDAIDRVPGRYERLAVERQSRDMDTAAARGFWWDEESAERVVAFIEKHCRHHKGEWAGRPFILAPWQREIVRAIFGWRRDDGTRRYRTAYVEIPRKNGKTELAAAISLYCLTSDREAGGEVYYAATKKDQARICFDAASAMVAQSPGLKRFVKFWRAGPSLVCDRLGSKALPLGADSNTLDGLNPSAVVVDELHAHTDPRVWTVLRTALGARRQPLTAAITTAGTYDPESIGWQQHEYAQKVLDDVFQDDSFYAWISHADDGADYFSAETQAQANPNYGLSAKIDYLAAQAELAKRQPSSLNDYLRLHLDLWPQQVTRWLDVERWLECDDTPIDEEALKGRECYAGLDLSSRLDLTALVLVFPEPDGSVTVLPRFWLPEAAIDRESKKGRRHYAEWAEQGYLLVVPGDTIDDAFVEAEIIALSERYRIAELAYDPWNANSIAPRLQETHGLTCIETRQGYRTMSEPAKLLETLIVKRAVHHGGHPILRWCVQNAVVRRDPNGNIAPDKSKASDKIDGVVASVMAISRSMLQTGEPEAGKWLSL
jgi:phage terminase large subunit-like protein